MWIQHCLLTLLALSAQDTDPTPAALSHGPFLGHAAPGAAMVWARANQPGEYRMMVWQGAGEENQIVVAQATEKGDLTLTFDIADLEPGGEYQYRVLNGNTLISGVHNLRAGVALDTQKVQLCFASCANEKRMPEQKGWARMLDVGAEAIVLLGDMPYIDSTELAVQRRRYREFYSVPDVSAALGKVPFYATWDDHDFGRNDTNGLLPGKENSRQAFLENHANPSYGEDGVGIYTHFRRGPVDVFLLDARTFAGTEPSPFDAEKTSLLGAAQWKWLERELAASTAPFKILATGMIWNGATRPGKKDHWMTYPHERQAVFDYIGEKRISGVVLVGGDIHRSRALRYPTTESAGYELTELITSPLANTVIEAANAPSPHLLHDVGQKETFLLVTVDMTAKPPTLVGKCMNAAGEELFEVALDLAGLTAE
jgi:alkaline phosphatase D